MSDAKCDEQECEKPVFGVIQGLWICKEHFDWRQIAIYDQARAGITGAGLCPYCWALFPTLSSLHRVLIDREADA